MLCCQTSQPGFCFYLFFFPFSFLFFFFFLFLSPRPSVSTFKSLKCFPLPGPPSCFYPCRFPFSLSLLLIALKHQSITCTGCGLCLGAVHQPAFQGRAPPPPRWAPRCPARSNSAAGGFSFFFFFQVSRFNMEECLNVVQLVGSHTGCRTSHSLSAGTTAPHTLLPHPPSSSLNKPHGHVTHPWKISF